MAVAEKVIRVSDMSCSHCQSAVTEALAQVPGVESVDVDLDAHKATVRFDEARASVAKLVEAIAEAGYTPQL